MPIHCYSGLPGSGKSYSVVEKVILPTLKANRRIVTNLPLTLEEIYKDFPLAEIEIVNIREQPEIFDLENNPSYRGAVFVMDEIWQKWPAGMTPQQMPQIEKSFFAEHRHYVGDDGLTNEIIIVCQSLSQIANFIRELVDTTFISSKLDKVGLDKKFRIDIYSGACNLQRRQENGLIRSGYSAYSKDVYKYYRSHTRNETSFMSGIENHVDKRANLLGSTGFLTLAAIAIVGVFGAFYWFFTSWGDTSKYHKEAPKIVQNHTVPTSPPPGYMALSNQSLRPAVSTSDTPAELPLSKDWRIAAILHGKKVYATGHALLINNKTSQTREISLRGHCSTVPRTRWEWVCKIDGEQITYWSGYEKNRNTFM